MSRRQVGTSGFTLMELMIVVAILGILAAVAIPAFTMLVRRAKAAESVNNLSVMFKSASAYYSGERAQQGTTTMVSGYCTVSDGGPIPPLPLKKKQVFSTTGDTLGTNDASLAAIGFMVADYVYYSYKLQTVGGSGGCGHNPGEVLYTLSAFGDLDEDTTKSTFELAVGSDGNNTLYHARGFYIVNELE